MRYCAAEQHLVSSTLKKQHNRFYTVTKNLVYLYSSVNTKQGGDNSRSKLKTAK